MRKILRTAKFDRVQFGSQRKLLIQFFKLDKHAVLLPVNYIVHTETHKELTSSPYEFLVRINE